MRRRLRTILTSHLLELADLGVILLFDLTLTLVAFRALPLGSGMLSYGDLPGIFHYRPIDSHWLFGLSLYPLSDQLLAQAVSASLAQNIVYLAALAFPSIGIYFLARQFAGPGPLSITVAVVYGTILNPLLVNNFLNGAFEFCLWFGLTTASLSLVISAGRTTSPMGRMLGAGILMGLAVLQSDSLGLFDYAAVSMSLMALLPSLVVFLLNRALSLTRRLMAVGVLLGSFVGLISPVVASAAANYASATGSRSGLSQVNAYVQANARFTFAHYTFLAALLNSPFTATARTWEVSILVPWAIIIGLTLAGALLKVFWARGRDSYVAATNLAAYLAVSLFMAGVASGALIGVYVTLRPLDLLDDPRFYQYIQCVFLIPLTSIVIAGIRDGLRVLPTGIRVVSREAAVDPAHRLARKPFGIVVTGRPLRRPVSTLVVAAPLLVVGILSLAYFAPNLEVSFSSDVYTSNINPFVPPQMESVHEWYAQDVAPTGGQVLLLPNAYGTYTQMSAFMPTSRLWTIPFLANLDNSSYNASAYIATMTLLAEDNVSAFAYQIGLSGVSSILLLNTSTEVSLYPIYLNHVGLSLPYATLASQLRASTALSVQDVSPQFVAFGNNLYLHAPTTEDSLIAYRSGAGSDFSISREVLMDPDLTTSTGFSKWIHWPTSGVTLAAQRVQMSVESNRSPPYALLADGINLSYAGNVTGFQNGSVSIAVDPADYNSTFFVYTNFSIPAGVRFYVLCFFYNSTSNRTLYSEFSIATLLNATFPTDSLATPLVPPVGTTFARLYYYAVPVQSGVDQNVTISTASVDERVTFRTLPDLVPAAYNVGVGLEHAAAVPSPSLLLLGPITPVGSLPAGFPSTTVVVTPLPAVDPQLSPNLCTNLSNLAGSSTIVREPTAAFLSGYSSKGGTVRWTVGGDQYTNTTASAGTQFVSTTQLPAGAAWGAIPICLRLTGNFTLALIGLVSVVAASSASSVPAVHVLLPIGTLQLTETGSAIDIARSPGGPGTAEIQLLNALDSAPMGVLCGLVLVYAVARTKRVRRHLDRPRKQQARTDKTAKQS